MTRHEPTEPGRFAYEGLQRVFHEKARLSIVCSLAAHDDPLTFNDLKDLCALTDGNLSRHLQMLQDAGVVEVTKTFHANRPQTLCALTPVGRKRFAQYVAELERVVSDAMILRQARGRSAGELASE